MCLACLCLFALSEMQKRVSTNPLERVAGLSYPVWADEIPAYYATQSEEGRMEHTGSTRC